MSKKGKKNTDKFDEKYIYTVDKVFDSGTTANFTASNYNTAASWVITDAPVSIEEKIENAGKKFTKKLKKGSKYNKAKFCQTCGNMYEEGLDDNFCNAECKYKYCEIEDEADKHSE